MRQEEIQRKNEEKQVKEKEKRKKDRIEKESRVTSTYKVTITNVLFIIVFM